VRAALAGCHMLVLEANHDDALLWRGPYPWSVKQRIASSHGHLSNRAAAELARELHHPGLAAVVLAHLSQHCNDGGIAKFEVGRTLDRIGWRGTLEVAIQDRPLEPIDVMLCADGGARSSSASSESSCRGDPHRPIRRSRSLPIANTMIARIMTKPT
jgi:hypothetical protein